jgi:hypothetical protein
MLHIRRAPFHTTASPSPHVATAQQPPHLLTPPTANACHASRQTRPSLTVRRDAPGVFGTLARRVKKTQVALHPTPSHCLQRTSPTYFVLAVDWNSPHGMQSPPWQMTSMSLLPAMWGVSQKKLAVSSWVAMCMWRGPVLRGHLRHFNPQKRDNHGFHILGRWARIAWGVLPSDCARCWQ